MSGGEITISPNFDELVTILNENISKPLGLASSGIRYSKTLENIFSQSKCWEVISLDSGCKETYFKLKQVDCFDTVVNNIKEYIKNSPPARRMISLKYIIVDGINDNKEEIKKFIDVVSDLGIERVIADVNFEQYSVTNSETVPLYYRELIDYFKYYSECKNINFELGSQTQQIMDKKIRGN